MSSKVTAWPGCFLLGAPAILLPGGIDNTTRGLAMLAWLLAFWLSSIVAFRCPHCRHPAMRIPDSVVQSPFVGSNCRTCGEPY